MYSQYHEFSETEIVDCMATIATRTAHTYSKTLGQNKKAIAILETFLIKHFSRCPFKAGKNVLGLYGSINTTMGQPRNSLKLLRRITPPIELEETYLSCLLQEKLLCLIYGYPVAESPDLLIEQAELLVAKQQTTEELEKLQITSRFIALHKIWTKISQKKLEEAEALLEQSPDKTEPSYLTLKACLLQDQGKLEQALEAAKAADVQKTKQRPLTIPEKIVLEIIRDAELRKTAKVASAPEPTGTEDTTISTVTKKPAPGPILPTIDETFIRNGDWRLYFEVFPKNRTAAIHGKLTDICDLLREMLSDKTGYNDLAGTFTNRTSIYIPEKPRQALKKLGIESIEIFWHEESLRVSFNVLRGIFEQKTSFEASLTQDLELKIQTSRNVELGILFLEALILEYIYRTACQDPTYSEVEQALEAEPEDKQTTFKPKIPKKKKQFEFEPKKPDTEKIDKAEAPIPAPPPLSPEQLFYKRNLSAFEALSTLIANQEIDVLSENKAAIVQILDLIEIIETRRDQAEAVNGFKITPGQTDILQNIIQMLNILGPIQGRKKLEELKLSQDAINDLGFSYPLPSNLLSVVEITFGGSNNLVCVLQRNGELKILGTKEQEELIDQLQRTVLESLARVVVPELGEIYRIADLPREMRPNQIAKAKTDDDDPKTPKRRFRLLPAIVILAGRDSAGETAAKRTTKVLQKIIEESQRAIVEQGQILELPLFHKNGDLYMRFLGETSERQALLSRLDPSQIFVQMRRGHSFRLPIGQKKTPFGNFDLLPYEMDPKKGAVAAQSGLALDFRVRPYLYGILKYPGNQYIVHPKVSVFPTQEYPSVTASDIKYRQEVLGGFSLKIHPDIPEELADQLITTPQAYLAVKHWQSDCLPELDYANPERIERLAGLTLVEKYFLITLTNRGYHQGIFVPLTNYLAEEKN